MPFPPGAIAQLISPLVGSTRKSVSSILRWSRRWYRTLYYRNISSSRQYKYAVARDSYTIYIPLRRLRRHCIQLKIRAHVPKILVLGIISTVVTPLAFLIGDAPPTPPSTSMILPSHHFYATNSPLSNLPFSWTQQPLLRRKYHPNSVPWLTQ